jgi:SHAQKYF class myb-like DNA-binding protein
MGSDIHDEPKIVRGAPLGFKRNDEPRPDGGAESKVGTDKSSDAGPMEKRRRDRGDADMGESRSKVSKYEGCTAYLEEEYDDYPPAEEDKSQLEEEAESNIRDNSGRTAKAAEEIITASSSDCDESETNWKIDKHQAFVAAVFEIGLMSCSPSVIMENMINLPPHITRERTKSHLQKFRKAKGENKEHFLKEYDEFFTTAEEIKAVTTSKGAVAPREDAILSSVLGGRNSNELVGGDAAAILSYSIINNCQHTPDPTKLPFRGVSASFPTLTETETDSELGASLIYVKGLLSHMTEHLLTTRLGQHHRKKYHLSSSSLSKMASKESATIRSVPKNSIRPYDTVGSSGGERQDSCLCSDEEGEEAQDRRSHLVLVSAGPQKQKVIASGVHHQSSSLNHRPAGQQPFNSTMQHGYYCYDPSYSSAGQVDPTLSRQVYVAPNSYWSHPPGLIHPNLNNQPHHAPYLQQHIPSYRNYPQMHPTNNNWHLSSLYHTHAERGWHQEQPPSYADPHHHQQCAHHDRSTRLPPPQRPPPRPPLQEHPYYTTLRYNDDAPRLHNPYPYQDIDSSLIEDGGHGHGVWSREKEEGHQRSRSPRPNLELSFNFDETLHPGTPEDISPIGKHSDQDHMLWDLVPGKNANDVQTLSHENPHRQYAYPRNHKECGAPFDSNVIYAKRAWEKAQHPPGRQETKKQKNEAHPLWL